MALKELAVFSDATDAGFSLNGELMYDHEYITKNDFVSELIYPYPSTLDAYAPNEYVTIEDTIFPTPTFDLNIIMMGQDTTIHFVYGGTLGPSMAEGSFPSVAPYDAILGNNYFTYPIYGFNLASGSSGLMYSGTTTHLYMLRDGVFYLKDTFPLLPGTTSTIVYR